MDANSVPLRSGGVVALGVDVAEPRKGLDLVALDGERRILATVRRATRDDVLGLVADLRPQVVCIDSPSGWSSSGRSRASERELARIGLSAFSTPGDPGDHPFYRWMRAGFAVYEALSPTHPVYRGGAVRGSAAEVFPEATSVLLGGRFRATGESKVQFRRAVLAEQGLDSVQLRSADQVDAALAALTGILALGGTFTAVGDPAEGLIVLPVTELPATRLRR